MGFFSGDGGGTVGGGGDWAPGFEPPVRFTARSTPRPESRRDGQKAKAIAGRRRRNRMAKSARKANR